MDLPNRTRLRIYSWGDRVENELFWRGLDGHESNERKVWIKMVTEKGDILDVGANTGTYAFIAKAISPNSNVVAFEPLQRVAKRIVENISISGLSVIVECKAVSDTVGYMPIYDPGGDNAYSASLEADFLPGEKESYPVLVTTIEQFCWENDIDPIAIKIDVEGSEGKVLLGARKIIEKRRVKILCEWLGNTDSHYEAINMLNSNGYIAVDVADFSPVDLESVATYENRNVLLMPA